MGIKISNCYYHGNRPAVATCAQCGVGICRECAVKDDSGRIICYKCGNSNLKQEHKEYREMIKEQGGRFRNGTEFIVPGIIGILIAIAGGWFIYFGPFDMRVFTGVNKDFIMIEYLLFSSPFGMIMLNDRFAPKYDTWSNLFNTWFLKVMFSFFIGGIVFAFYLFRFVMSKITL